ncbi:unnamed protein product [Rotaria sp. Silwood1]|nr:unnamed protein product [Rotaria sp. Silwood1]CAF4886350.1 unnamed protein product [Rotaria sp. Silwood1]
MDIRDESQKSEKRLPSCLQSPREMLYEEENKNLQMISVVRASDRSSNETGVSRTNAEHIAVIREFLTKFYLHEITFVVHLNSVYSMYDVERVERITSQLRLTFGTEHDVNHVRGLIDFFSDQTRQPQAWHHINIERHLLTDAAAHHMEPFIAICQVCNQHLNMKNCNKTMVYICYQRGKVLPEQGDTKTINAKSLYNGEFVYLGGKYAYERALIEQYTADLVTNANSWMKTVDSLNRQAFNGEQHQVHIIDRRTLALSGVIPKTGVYDDGCHLIEYLHNHIGKDLIATNAAKELAQVKFSVDRTHFRNHVGSWCRANMNPDKNPCKLFSLS